MKEEITSRLESDYLIVSNKKKCKELLNESELSEEDIIDTLISLHIVLEAGLNTLYRHLVLLSIEKSLDKLKIIENIDQISFIDKTALFIYNSKFNFEGKKEKAEEYHKIIGMIKDFSTVRNKLIHGHSISTIHTMGRERKDSSLKKKINLDFLKQQVSKFCFILKGLRFYLDCLDSSLSETGKEDLKREYLNDEFLPYLR